MDPVLTNLHRILLRGINRARHGVVLVPVFLICCYQALVRPLLVGSCKFCPSCSEYAIEALQRHGLLRGIILAARRLCRCHPFTPGGIDPVPESSARHTSDSDRDSSHHPSDRSIETIRAD